MKVSCTNAARMMLVLLFTCLAWGTPAAYGQASDECCNSILDLQITQVSEDQCCVLIRGKIDINKDCFKFWQLQEYIGGTWVNVGGPMMFNSDGTFSYVHCGPGGYHLIRVLFLGPNGQILCEKRMEYTCEDDQDCCDYIYGPYITPLPDQEPGWCCFTISGKVVERGLECFERIQVQILENGVWVDHGWMGINADGSYTIDLCVPSGTYQIRLLFWGRNGEILCERLIDYVCEDDCCDLIQGPYISPEPSEPGWCCFWIKGSVTEMGLERCFQSYEFEILENGVWVNDGVSYVFNPDGTFYLYKCLPYGTHQMRILFRGHNGEIICIKELTYTCEGDCCELINGPYIASEPVQPEPGWCCFRIWGGVGQIGMERCFSHVDIEMLENGNWTHIGSSGFDGSGNFFFVHCLPAGSYVFRVVFYGHDGTILCERRIEYTCKNDCCETIHGPYIGLAPVEPRPGYCCFTINGSVGQNNRCFSKMQLEFLENGIWVNPGTSYGFNPDGSFSILVCRPYGTHQIRVLFYDHAGNVICVRELTYTCENRCCETIQGPYIGQAPVEPQPGRCCFIVSGTVGEGNPCFTKFDFELLVNGNWTYINTYGFNPDGSFSFIHCVPPGSYQIRLRFRNAQNQIVCEKLLEYTCESNCCETIQGPYIGPASIDPPPGRCCFTVSGSIGRDNPCFRSWQFEIYQNGVWVNDLVSYTFNPDGTFSLTKCVPYGSYPIRILFLDANGRVICEKYLRWRCEGDCCESIQGPYVSPAINPEPGKCCFTVSGTIGEGNPCFTSWQYEEFINGVWVNDLVSYTFNPDGSFSITKCRPYGTHQIRILFLDADGKVICRRDLTYTCENECCETIQGPFISPAVVQEPGRCCFTISGSIGECNPCFRNWEYEEFINGVWVNDAVSYLFDANGNFSITKCRPYGTHLIRILFYDHNGDVICVKELSYTCEPPIDCCETIQGPFVTTTAVYPDRCCFRVDGTVGPENPCFRNWEFQRFENGVWISDPVSYLFDANGNFSITKCFPSGSYLFRIVFFDHNGKPICEREFRYECANTCCETIQGPYINTISVNERRCCFEVTGSVGPDNPCFRNWEFERLVNGVWVNDAVSYIFQPDGSFSIIKCVPPGTHTFRILFRDHIGKVICVKEFEYSCNNDCCDRIQGPVVTPAPSPSPNLCCFKISGTVGYENQCFRSWEFERLVNGAWVNDGVSYTFAPDGSFSLNKCLPATGTYTMRLLFRDFNGRVICIKEFEYGCDHPCCESIDGPYIAPASSPRPGVCCFKIFGRVNPDCFMSWEFERLVNGVWVNDQVSYIFQPDGSFSLLKCLPSGTHQIRILFRDYTGRVICIRELSYTCQGGKASESDGEALKMADVGAGDVVSRFASRPNPASDQMTVSYELVREASVRMSLHSHIGQELLLIEEGVQPAGERSLPVVLNDLASGVYFIRLIVDGVPFDLPVTIVK